MTKGNSARQNKLVTAPMTQQEVLDNLRHGFELIRDGYRILPIPATEDNDRPTLGDTTLVFVPNVGTVMGVFDKITDEAVFVKYIVRVSPCADGYVEGFSYNPFRPEGYLFRTAKILRSNIHYLIMCWRKTA